MMLSGKVGRGVLLAALFGAASLRATTWTNMLGGVWNEPGNWNLGVPDGTSAYLTETAASYRVTVGETPLGVVSNMTVSNVAANTTRLDIAASGFTVSNGYVEIGRSAEVCVTNGGAWAYAGRTPSGNRIAVVRDGGLLRVDGGTVAFTNLTAVTPANASRMLVGDWSAGRLAVTAGTFSMNGVFTAAETNKAVEFYLGNGSGSDGRMEVSGTGRAEFGRGWGTILYIGNSAGGYGRLEVSGTGRVEVSNEWVTCLNIGSSGTGVLELKDRAEFEFLSTNKTAYLAVSAGSTGRVTVAGNSKFLMPTQLSVSSFYMGTGAGALAEITVCDDGVMSLYKGSGLLMGGADTLGQSVITVRDRGYFEAGGGLYMCPVLHGKTGYAEINLQGGTLAITNSTINAGLYVGQVKTSASLGFAKACFNMSGGFLNLMKDYYGHNYGARDGIVIGAVAGNNLIGGAQGDFNLSGGAVTNFGALTIGWGQGATGTVSQTGGRFVQGKTNVNVLRNVVVGWGGGYGRYLMSGGDVLVYDPVFVGGVTTNQLGYDLSKWTTFTMDKASKGLLRVDNGRFTVTNNMALYCGSKGEGTIAIGSNGVCEAKNIVLTNNTQSVVLFDFGKQGCGVLRATDTLKICEGAQLGVDARAYAGKETWFKLIDCATRVGAFAPENITVAGHGQVVQNETGVWLHSPRGTVIQLL